MRKILFLADQTHQSVELMKLASDLSVRCECSLVICRLVNTSKALEVAMAGNVSSSKENHEHDNLYSISITNSGKNNSEYPDRLDTIYLDSDLFETTEINKIVVEHTIWMILVEKPSRDWLRKTKNTGLMQLDLNKLNCPLFMLPGYINCRSLSSIGYVTDLRYCDYNIIRFLKTFSCSIFLIHLTAPGLVDMDDRFGKELLKEEITKKTGCNELFLLNIKGKGTAEKIDKFLEISEFKILSFFHGSQSVSDRLIGKSVDNLYNYHDLPFLIFPYLNWFQHPSFYEET